MISLWKSLRTESAVWIEIKYAEERKFDEKCMEACGRSRRRIMLNS